MKPKHPWWARLCVAVLMLLLAFTGIIVTDLESSGGWAYWKWIIPINAALALWLSWYERRQKETISPITLGHEALHWLGLFGVIVLLEVYVEMGLLGRFLASLIALTVLSFTIFTIGIYVEWAFILTGLILAIFALVVALAVKFLYAITIPAIILGIGALAYFLYRAKKTSSKDKSLEDHDAQPKGKQEKQKSSSPKKRNV